MGSAAHDQRGQQTGFFIIIEVEDGMMIVECPADFEPEHTAEEHGGFLVDAGPYRSYEEAYDRLLDVQIHDEHEERAP